jgi:thymidylate synthase (FAD)
MENFKLRGESVRVSAMKISVLDHGYIQLIEVYGQGSFATSTAAEVEIGTSNDYEVGIIEAARQSTQGNFRGWDQDEKLLSYLYKNKHATPFEFAGLIIEVQAPIFVFREWHRHRTQSYNEMSARYAPLPDLYYIPTVERVMMNGGANKQAQGVGPSVANKETAEFWINISLKSAYEHCEHLYQDALAVGVPKELARCVMPVGHYSRMRASANLRNWLAFISLRADYRAQWEIRQYADALGQIIQQAFPKTWELFMQEKDET